MGSRRGKVARHELAIDDGVKVVVQSGKSPIVEGVQEERMRVGCGSATIGMFAQQWFGKVDEVVVVDDHITGVLSEHQAGKMLGVPETGISTDHVPGPRGPVTFADLCLRQYIITPT